MTLPDPRVPGAEPLSNEQIARLIRRCERDARQCHIDAGYGLEAGDPALFDRMVAALRELQALRAERTAAPASGEVQIIASEMRGCLAGTNVQLIGQTMAAAIASWAERLTAALASSLTPQQDVGYLLGHLYRWFDSAGYSQRTTESRIVERLMATFPAPKGNAADWPSVESLLARVPPAPQPRNSWWQCEDCPCVWMAMSRPPECLICGGRSIIPKPRIQESMGLSGHLVVAPESSPRDVGAHPDCPRCKGSGKTDNAQFSCGCRWAGSPYRQAAEAAQARSADRVDLEQIAREVASIALDCDHGIHVLWCGDCLDKAVAALQRARETGDAS